MSWLIAYADIGLLLAIPLFKVETALKVHSEVRGTIRGNIIGYMLYMVLMWPMAVLGRLDMLARERRCKRK